MLEKLIASSDRGVLEGNNQKQADFLARMLVQTDPGKLHDLHMIMPSVSLPERFVRELAEAVHLPEHPVFFRQPQRRRLVCDRRFG
jgi:hypothetical protein